MCHAPRRDCFREGTGEGCSTAAAPSRVRRAGRVQRVGALSNCQPSERSGWGRGVGNPHVSCPKQNVPHGASDSELEVVQIHWCPPTPSPSEVLSHSGYTNLDRQALRDRARLALRSLLALPRARDLGQARAVGEVEEAVLVALKALRAGAAPCNQSASARDAPYKAPAPMAAGIDPNTNAKR